ncbi:hypothetical protein [Neobacillus niacini]|nr:hypothetical protein [Neobacillus niacini]MDR7001320.1 hypothetical protein [Neobacillus niacini]
MNDHMIDEELFKSAQERIQSIKVKHAPHSSFKQIGKMFSMWKEYD